MPRNITDKLILEVLDHVVKRVDKMHTESLEDSANQFLQGACSSESLRITAELKREARNNVREAARLLWKYLRSETRRPQNADW